MKKPLTCCQNRGFSMVEVTMALGLISFAMLGVLGLLPVGLSTVQQAMVQTGEAGIARQIRSDLQQISLTSLPTFASQPKYYTPQGIRVASASSTDAYFIATFSVTDPSIAGAATSFNTSAKLVKVTLKYPATAPTAAQKSKVFTLLTAGQ